MPDIIPFLTQHWQLTTAFLVVAVLLAIVEAVRKARGSSALTPGGVTALVNHDDAVVLDIRSKEAFASGHILGAISAPWAELQSNTAKFTKYKQKPLVIVDAMGQESARAVAALKAQGFEKIQILGGGMRAWSTAGLPVAKG